MPYLTDLLFFAGTALFLSFVARLYMFNKRSTGAGKVVSVHRRRRLITGIFLSLAVAVAGGYMKYRLKYFNGMRCAAVIAFKPVGWESIMLGRFQISLPKGWQYVPAQGIDSFVGQLTNGEMELSFDYGWYSNRLDRWQGPGFDRNCRSIDGYVAVIVNEYAAQTGRVGIHFPDLGGGNGLTITGRGTPDQRKQAISAFQQIRF